MRFKHSSDKNETWWVSVSVPARDLSTLLSPADQSRYLDFEILLHIEVEPFIGGKFEYAQEWALPPVGNYPKMIIWAIDKYLAGISVDDKFGATIRSAIWVL